MISKQYLIDVAKNLQVPVSTLKAIIEVECSGSGFNGTEPKILFERHIMYKQLKANKGDDVALMWYAKNPELVNPTTGGYGLPKDQHKRLQQAISIDRVSALESASWGIGQIMGYQWKNLGYPSLQAFINDMYASEEKQFDAVVRYLRVNNLLPSLRKKNWTTVALIYNGKNFIKNDYANKLKKADLKFSKEG